MTGGFAGGHCGFTGDLLVSRHLVRKDVALVDPDLYADAAVGGLGFTEAVVDVGAKGVERNATFTVELTTSHFGTTETTSTLNADTESASLLHGLHGTLHGTTETHTASQAGRQYLGQ